MDEARSGVAHSGNFASGDYVQSFALSVGGTVRSTLFDTSTLAITYTLDGTPDMLQVEFFDFQPLRGQEILVYDGGLSVGVPLFAGHIMEVSQHGARKDVRPRWVVEAVDYTWLMDRYARITKRYSNLGINTIVADILANYTNGGFQTGYISSALGTIDDIQFTGETVSGAIDRLTKTVSGGAYWVLDSFKHVNIFTTPAYEANSLSLTDGGVDPSWWDFVSSIDLSQVRTKVIHVGNGALTTSVVSGSATTIPVDDCRWYASSGGRIRCGETEATYTGKTVNEGPGSLTGVSGLTQDLPQGAQVYVVAVVEDTTAQTNLAAILGGGLSGIAVDYQTDHRLSLDECTKRATAELNFYSGALQDIEFVTDDRYIKPGKTVVVNLTEPATVSTTARVQQVELTVRTKLEGSTVGMQRAVKASAVRRQLVDLLLLQAA